MRDTEEMAGMLAENLGAPSLPVLVASTGIIGRRLPMDKVRAGVQAAFEALGKADLHDAATAIMTTDTFPKAAAAKCSIAGKNVVIGGIAKGAGMIAPNMGTMIGFVFTDAAMSPETLRSALNAVVPTTFNSVTIDGDTSTNDTLAALASGKAGNKPVGCDSEEKKQFVKALHAVCLSLAKQIARDGEGATKLVEIRVTGAASGDDARRIARTIAESPLVKTALHGEDPNWGRIMAAAGRSGATFDTGEALLSIGGVSVFENGAPTGSEERAHEKMTGREIIIELSVGKGPGAATFYTCDLSKEYVTINADYHT
ncbi:MAG TPA: bifunctional glutamate N-acetyltransferase/amino-acid acetyltransferase ArgJ, partial [Planctomycetes bacterium]|nr:bifunctional glutamate N-acetyltransferase/amino-acid acetyltransferase ArgJ [Planctomycetota bacterium]